MALQEIGRMTVSSIKRFPQHIREELNKVLQRSSWQSMTREFSVDVFTGLQLEALDDIVDLVDDSYPEFKEDVKKRLKILKKTTQGQTQSFKGKSKVGLHSNFYRYLINYELSFSYPYHFRSQVDPPHHRLYKAISILFYICFFSRYRKNRRKSVRLRFCDAVESRLTTTPLIRPLRYCGHLFQSEENA